MRRSDRWSVLRPGGGKCVEDVGGSIAEVPVGGSDVGAAAEPDDVDRCVAQGGHDLGAVAGAHAGVVLALGDVAHAVQAVLDRPVRVDQSASTCRSASRCPREVITYTVSTDGLAWPARPRRRTTLIGRAPCGTARATACRPGR